MVVVVVAVLGTTHSSGVVEAAAFGGPFLHSKQQFGLPNSPEKTKIINNNNNNNYHEPRSSMPFGRQRQWQQRDPSINGIWKMSKNDDTTTTTTTTTNSVDVDAASQKNKEYERRARLSNKTKALFNPKKSIDKIKAEKMKQQQQQQQEQDQPPKPTLNIGRTLVMKEIIATPKGGDDDSVDVSRAIGRDGDEELESSGSGIPESDKKDSSTTSRLELEELEEQEALLSASMEGTVNDTDRKASSTALFASKQASQQASQQQQQQQQQKGRSGSSSTTAANTLTTAAKTQKARSVLKKIHGRLRPASSTVPVTKPGGRHREEPATTTDNNDDKPGDSNKTPKHLAADVGKPFMISDRVEEYKPPVNTTNDTSRSTGMDSKTILPDAGDPVMISDRPPPKKGGPKDSTSISSSSPKAERKASPFSFFAMAKEETDATNRKAAATKTKQTEPSVKKSSFAVEMPLEEQEAPKKFVGSSIAFKKDGEEDAESTPVAGNEKEKLQPPPTEEADSKNDIVAEKQAEVAKPTKFTIPRTKPKKAFTENSKATAFGVDEDATTKSSSDVDTQIKSKSDKAVPPRAVKEIENGTVSREETKPLEVSRTTVEPVSLKSKFKSEVSAATLTEPSSSARSASREDDGVDEDANEILDTPPEVDVTQSEAPVAPIGKKDDIEKSVEAKVTVSKMPVKKNVVETAAKQKSGMNFEDDIDLKLPEKERTKREFGLTPDDDDMEIKSREKLTKREFGLTPDEDITMQLFEKATKREFEVSPEEETDSVLPETPLESLSETQPKENKRPLQSLADKFTSVDLISAEKEKIRANRRPKIEASNRIDPPRRSSRAARPPPPTRPSTKPIPSASAPKPYESKRDPIPSPSLSSFGSRTESTDQRPKAAAQPFRRTHPPVPKVSTDREDRRRPPPTRSPPPAPVVTTDRDRASERRASGKGRVDDTNPIPKAKSEPTVPKVPQAVKFAAIRNQFMSKGVFGNDDSSESTGRQISAKRVSVEPYGGGASPGAPSEGISTSAEASLQPEQQPAATETGQVGPDTYKPSFDVGSSGAQVVSDRRVNPQPYGMPAGSQEEYIGDYGADYQQAQPQADETQGDASVADYYKPASDFRSDGPQVISDGQVHLQTYEMPAGGQVSMGYEAPPLTEFQSPSDQHFGGYEETVVKYTQPPQAENESTRSPRRPKTAAEEARISLMRKLVGDPQVDATQGYTPAFEASSSGGRQQVSKRQVSTAPYSPSGNSEPVVQFDRFKRKKKYQPADPSSKPVVSLVSASGEIQTVQSASKVSPKPYRPSNENKQISTSQTSATPREPIEGGGTIMIAGDSAPPVKRPKKKIPASFASGAADAAAASRLNSAETYQRSFDIDPNGPQQVSTRTVSTTPYQGQETIVDPNTPPDPETVAYEMAIANREPYKPSFDIGSSGSQVVSDRRVNPQPYGMPTIPDTEATKDDSTLFPPPAQTSQEASQLGQSEPYTNYGDAQMVSETRASFRSHEDFAGEQETIGYPPPPPQQQQQHAAWAIPDPYQPVDQREIVINYEDNSMPTHNQQQAGYVAGEERFNQPMDPSAEPAVITPSVGQDATTSQVSKQPYQPPEQQQQLPQQQQYQPPPLQQPQQQPQPQPQQYQAPPPQQQYQAPPPQQQQQPQYQVLPPQQQQHLQYQQPLPQPPSQQQQQHYSQLPQEISVEQSPAQNFDPTPVENFEPVPIVDGRKEEQLSYEKYNNPRRETGNSGSRVMPPAGPEVAPVGQVLHQYGTSADFPSPTTGFENSNESSKKGIADYQTFAPRQDDIGSSHKDENLPTIFCQFTTPEVGSSEAVGQNEKAPEYEEQIFQESLQKGMQSAGEPPMQESQDQNAQQTQYQSQPTSQDSMQVERQESFKQSQDEGQSTYRTDYQSDLSSGKPPMQESQGQNAQQSQYQSQPVLQDPMQAERHESFQESQDEGQSTYRTDYQSDLSPLQPLVYETAESTSPPEYHVPSMNNAASVTTVAPTIDAQSSRQESPPEGVMSSATSPPVVSESSSFVRPEIAPEEQDRYSFQTASVPQNSIVDMSSSSAPAASKSSTAEDSPSHIQAFGRSEGSSWSQPPQGVQASDPGPQSPTPKQQFTPPPPRCSSSEVDAVFAASAFAKFAATGNSPHDISSPTPLFPKMEPKADAEPEGPSAGESIYNAAPENSHDPSIPPAYLAAIAAASHRAAPPLDEDTQTAGNSTTTPTGTMPSKPTFGVRTAGFTKSYLDNLGSSTSLFSSRGHAMDEPMESSDSGKDVRAFLAPDANFEHPSNDQSGNLQVSSFGEILGTKPKSRTAKQIPATQWAELPTDHGPNQGAPLNRGNAATGFEAKSTISAFRPRDGIQ